MLWNWCLGSALKPENIASLNLRREKLDEWLSTNLIFESILNVWSFNSLGFWYLLLTYSGISLKEWIWFSFFDICCFKKIYHITAQAKKERTLKILQTFFLIKSINVVLCLRHLVFVLILISSSCYFFSHCDFCPERTWYAKKEILWAVQVWRKISFLVPFPLLHLL